MLDTLHKFEYKRCAMGGGSFYGQAYRPTMKCDGAVNNSETGEQRVILLYFCVQSFIAAVYLMSGLN